MTVTEYISDTFLKATGKTNTLTSGTKYDRIVALGNFYQRRWAREPEVDWNSLYDPAFSIGSVTATDSFDLDTSSVRKLSDREGDFVRIMHSDEGYSDYSIVEADKLKDYFSGQNKENSMGKYCARVGSQLVFNRRFTSDDQEFGGDIQVPCYTFPDPITSDNPDSDEIQVDDPDWLVTRAAAEYVRNDLTRRQRYPELIAESNEIMQRMKSDNSDTQIDLIDRPWTPGFGNDSAWS